MMFPAPASAIGPERRGMTTPVVAGVLLVAMLGLALILDRLWLEAARLELNTAAEAAALAAARELTGDRLLLPDVDRTRLEDDAVQAAIMTAVQNYAAGQPVIVNEADITFSSAEELSTTDSASQYLEQKSPPDRVVVTAHRTRFRGNPVALFISELTGQPWGDAVGQAAARIDGNVCGVRPVSTANVPAVPLAIWERDPTGERKDTWQAAIELRGGSDNFGYDPIEQTVTDEPDGIPELTLKSQAKQGTNAVANVQLLDIGNQFEDDKLRRQFERGWSTEDLANWGGELRLSGMSAAAASGGLTLRGMPTLESNDREDLESLLGVPRIALLYSLATQEKNAGIYEVECVRLVAIRVLSVDDLSNGSCQIVIQPTVLATRTALCEPQPQPDVEVENSLPSAQQRSPEGNYIYRLELTR